MIMTLKGASTMYDVIRIQVGKTYVINSNLPANAAMELATIMRMQNTDMHTTYDVRKSKEG